MNYLSVDIGTTACKYQLFSEKGEILAYRTEEYPFLFREGARYVNLAAIEACLRRMLGEAAREHRIDSVAISSIGESFVLLDGEDNVLFHPMLYTDERGAEEAEALKKCFSEEEIFSLTGTVPHSMYSVSKLLWIKSNEPALFERAEKVMLIADYFGYLLTGERAIDHSLAARTGVFDIRKKEFSEQLLSSLGIPRAWFSSPMPAGSVVGRIRPAFGVDAALVLGSHDQIAAALGAGALCEGDAVDGMGTVECITALFSAVDGGIRMGRQGYPIVPYAVEGLFCTYILNYSCGSAVRLVRENLMHGYKGGEASFFAYMEKEMADAPSGLLCLPYFGGASTPHQDLSARGAILGLGTQTRDAEIYRAVLEGTAMEMRYNMDTVKEYGIEVRSAVATGGGANSASWLRIKADIEGIPYKTLRSSEGGLCGLAMLQAVAMGGAKDLFSAKETFVRYRDSFLPRGGAEYVPYYEKYKKLYKTIKEIEK